MIDRTLTALCLAALATPVFAHPGTHEEVAADALVRHIVGSPFHVLGFGAAFGVVAMIVYRRVRRGDRHGNGV